MIIAKTKIASAGAPIDCNMKKPSLLPDFRQCNLNKKNAGLRITASPLPNYVIYMGVCGQIANIYSFENAVGILINRL